MAARSSSSEQSLQVPFGGMALRPAMALLTRPSRPPLASARTFHAAVSWFFGASSKIGRASCRERGEWLLFDVCYMGYFACETGAYATRAMHRCAFIF